MVATKKPSKSNIQESSSRKMLLAKRQSKSVTVKEKPKRHDKKAFKPKYNDSNIFSQFLN